MEKEHECMNGIDGLSLTQALDFGDFEISNIVAETDITRQEKAEHDASGQRFANPVSDEEVKNLVESQENVNTKKKTEMGVWSWANLERLSHQNGYSCSGISRNEQGRDELFHGTFYARGKKTRLFSISTSFFILDFLWIASLFKGLWGV
jgi:hypothetical protein